jgi:hypothetical protein
MLFISSADFVKLHLQNSQILLHPVAHNGTITTQQLYFTIICMQCVCVHGGAHIFAWVGGPEMQTSMII